MDMRKKNPNDFEYRVLKQRESSRNSGDELARTIIKYLESDSKSKTSLIKGLKKYSESENWNPGLNWLEENN